GAPELAAATGLTRNAVNLVLRRTPVAATPMTTPTHALEEVAAAARLWRQAEASYRDDQMLCVLVTELKTKAGAGERRACADRDEAMLACVRDGLPTGIIAETAEVSGSLIYTMTSTSTSDLGEHPGAEAELRQLAISVARWREARQRSALAGQRVSEHEANRRQAKVDERARQERRNELIARCAASGYTPGEIARWADLDVGTVTGSLSTPVGEVSLEDGRQALLELSEVSRAWRQAQQEAADQRALGELLASERRRCLGQEDSARRERNRALLACRRAGVTIAVLAARAQTDTRTIREALQKAEAAEQQEESEEIDGVLLAESA
ncbi:hypothetical protein, partial [Nonomuraea sp. NPDC049784]|uniref:hypothetical protein n=1 Tax=Nonomuraea sp. NPDC049784 TaxID=3154361 RepID=UPI0033CBEFED